MRLFLAAATIALVSLQIASGQTPLTLVGTIDLPGVEGRIDHLAVDTAAPRLYVAALGNDTVEVLDLKSSDGSASLSRGTTSGQPKGRNPHLRSTLMLLSEP